MTLVTQTTTDKLWMLSNVCDRWRGPMSLALWLNGTEDVQRWSEVIMRDAAKCPEFALSIVIAEGDYPVNYLRNLAVTKVNTTHQLVSDMDFLPSAGLRSAVQRWLRRGKVALVVPAFQRRGGNCATIAACRRKVEPLDANVPRTREGLRDCLGKKKCIAFQSDNSPSSHSTTNVDKWLDSDDLSFLRCFRSSRYEPYVVVDHVESPAYDERFVGYGKNKIQHVAHLRYLGFTFAVLPSHFLIHVPHPRSDAKKKWSGNFETHSHVDNLFHTFITELEQQQLRPRVDLCGGNKHRRPAAVVNYPHRRRHHLASSSEVPPPPVDVHKVARDLNLPLNASSRGGLVPRRRRRRPYHEVRNDAIPANVVFDAASHGDDDDDDDD